MFKRKTAVLVVSAFLFLPLVSWAQTSGTPAKSIESLKLTDIADDSIVMLSKEESGVPGYINAKYAYVNSSCPGGVSLVDYSGATFEVNDKSILAFERMQCARQAHDDSDGE